MAPLRTRLRVRLQALFMQPCILALLMPGPPVPDEFLDDLGPNSRLYTRQLRTLSDDAPAVFLVWFSATFPCACALVRLLWCGYTRLRSRSQIW